jgi:hypothetical protein
MEALRRRLLERGARLASPEKGVGEEDKRGYREAVSLLRRGLFAGPYYLKGRLGLADPITLGDFLADLEHYYRARGLQDRLRVVPKARELYRSETQSPLKRPLLNQILLALGERGSGGGEAVRRGRRRRSSSGFCHNGPRVLAVLLLPEFSELEAALALEWARRLELPAYTVAKGRKGTPALAGSVWTPTYAFPAAPPPKALLIPGARRPERPAKDPTWLAYLEEVWEGLEALFLGFNAHLFLAEAGRLPPRVAAGEEVAGLLQGMGYQVVPWPFSREGRVYATRGGLALLAALSDWVGKAIEL